jgi:hypothetical protein
MDTIIEERILDALTKFNDKLNDLHGDFREFKGTVTTQVNSLEKSHDNIDMWTNIKVVAVIPIVAALHVLASKVGLIK